MVGLLVQSLDEVKMAFKEDKYEIIRNAVHPEVIRFIQLNFDIHEYAGYTHKPPNALQRYPYGDPQSPNSFAFYSPLYGDSLLVYLRDMLEQTVNKKLVETYSYMRIYYTGGTLEKHIDRPSCQFSATLCVKKDIDWSIYFQKENGEEVEVELEPGDLAVYSGCILPHWRKPYTGNRHYQMFLHYIDAQGEFSPKHKWDERPCLWYPKTQMPTRKKLED